MGCTPLAIKKSLVFEKCLHPKKPLYADKGEGCALSKTRWRFSVIKLFLLRAFLPHKIKTTGDGWLLMIFITSSVNSVQPHDW